MELKILIISTSSEKINFYKTLFKDLGHEPSSAGDAMHGLKVFINYHKFGAPFDLVFTDYILPRMNGLNLAKQLLTIYPLVNLVLFPTKLFYESDLKKDYTDFGGFMQKEPDDDFYGYKDLITRTIQKKTVLTAYNSLQNNELITSAS